MYGEVAPSFDRLVVRRQTNSGVWVGVFSFWDGRSLVEAYRPETLGNFEVRTEYGT